MAQAGDNGGMADIKKNLRRMYELLSISVMDNREMAKDVKKMEDTVSYTSYQISNHDARIDDNESNLRELMGKVDKIQEDLQRLISLNQVSRVNGVCDEAALPMEEESVVKPGGNLQSLCLVLNECFSANFCVISLFGLIQPEVLNV